MVFYSAVLYPALPESSSSWAIPVIFILSIAGSFLVYRGIIKILEKKVNMEKYFDPIFGRKKY